MQKTDSLIRTKLRLPLTRSNLVLRSRLQARIAEGLRVPLILVIAPAGFGKTTLVAASLAECPTQTAWLSLDAGDNQAGRFMTYLIAALQEVDNRIGGEAAQLMEAMPVSPQAVLTSLINGLDATGRELVLVLDDYQFISSPAVHEQVAFLLEHCPGALHMLIATRSDPPLPLARLRARGQTVELRSADLRFTESETARFLNEVMGLRLDTGSVAALAERTEGWIAGLQMAALSMRDRKDILKFIEEFSGTNRYILDYLLEEVLASQSPEIRHFLLYTSILERLTDGLCDAVLTDDEGSKGEAQARSSHSPLPGNSAAILEYLERANLFLMPLDDDRRWYRYHHLFADLLRAELRQALGEPDVARLHLRAASWLEHNGLIIEAIHHASMAADDELVEHLIKQHYLEMMNRGEMSWIRSWMGNLSKDLIHRRPWLCLYEAMNRSWYGELEEAGLLLDEAEKHIHAQPPAPGSESMLGYHAYVKSRVTAMQGDTCRAIQFCLTAREQVPADRLDLLIDFSITLGYEYFLCGDFVNAGNVLNEMIRSGYSARAINNPVAAYCVLARAQAYQGQLHEAHALLERAARLIREAGGQHLGALGLVEVETAALLCEWNDLDPALVRLKRGLDDLPWWGKADDFCLAYITLSRIHLARGDRTAAADAVEKAAQLVQTRGVFSEARSVVEAAQVRMWLARRDWSALDRRTGALAGRPASNDPFGFEQELAGMTQARVLAAQNKPEQALRLLSSLDESGQAGGRQGRRIGILILDALARQQMGNRAQAELALTKSLTLAEPSGYVRVWLDEGQPMQALLAQWLAHAAPGPLRDYAARVLSQFDGAPPVRSAPVEKLSPTGEPIESLSGRELEVLHLIAIGMANREIATLLIISPGTVKAHTASIYRKLDVANRTEAVARARQLGILS